MDTTEDYLTVPPWVAIINMINRSYGLSLSPYATELIDFTPLEGTEVEITVRARRSKSEDNLLPEFTEGTYRYNRIDLGSFFPSGITIQDGIIPSSTTAIVDAYQTQSGYVFDFNDFVYRGADEQNYILEAGPRSLRWVGTTTIEIVPKAYDLNGMVSKKKSKDAIMYPSNDPDKIQGPLIYMDHDFNRYRDILADLEIGTPSIGSGWVTQILRDVTNDPWIVSSNPINWNLAGNVVDGEPVVTVLYNGFSRLPWSPRGGEESGTHVLVLELGENLCSNISGPLLIHYD